MTDAAAGSTAALTMMQNMGAAPLATDVGKAQAEAQVANAEKAKLSNLVAQSEFKADQEDKVKLQALAQTPEFKAADDVGKLKLAISAQMENGSVEKASKNMERLATFEAREFGAKAKELDVQAQQMGDSLAVLEAGGEGNVDANFKRLPPATQKGIIGKVGQENWDNFSNAQKLAAMKGLAQTTRARVVAQQGETSLERTRMIQEGNTIREQVREDTRIAIRSMGSDDREGKSSRDFITKIRSIDTDATRKEKNIQAEIDAALAAKKKATTLGFGGSAETAAYEAKLKKLEDSQRKTIENKIRLVESYKDLPDKAGELEDLNAQLALFPPKKSEAAPAKDSGNKAAPTAKAEAPTIESALKSQGVSYEPNKFDYKLMPDGSVASRLKQAAVKEEPKAAPKEEPKKESKPQRSYSDYMKAKSDLDKLQKDAPPKTKTVPSGVGATTKEIPNPEYEAWYKKNQSKVDELTAKIEANK